MQARKFKFIGVIATSDKSPKMANSHCPQEMGNIQYKEADREWGIAHGHSSTAMASDL
jgi:hypothetical protein